MRLKNCLEWQLLIRRGCMQWTNEGSVESISCSWNDKRRNATNTGGILEIRWFRRWKEIVRNNLLMIPLAFIEFVWPYKKRQEGGEVWKLLFGFWTWGRVVYRARRWMNAMSFSPLTSFLRGENLALGDVLSRDFRKRLPVPPLIRY